MKTVRFPDESNEYRLARNQLLDAEIALRAQIEQVAQMRRALPAGGKTPEDYKFVEIGRDDVKRTTSLSELFQMSHQALFVYSFMFGPQMEAACPSCSSVLDALNGNARHIAQRINLAVVARSPIERITAFAEARGWDHLRLLSSADNSYNMNYYAETDSGAQMPMVNVFSMQDGVVRHRWGTELLYAGLDGQPRHVDFMWPLWNVLDTVPEGRGDWNPELDV
jgi:predicted dithiol-disulfide oxidoreductase (DUF899 family)